MGLKAYSLKVLKNNEFRVKLIKLNFRLMIYFCEKIGLNKYVNAVSFCREAWSIDINNKRLQGFSGVKCLTNN